MTPRPYALDLPLRWGDMDAYGHVNNATFLRLLEEARIRAFRDWWGAPFDAEGPGVLVARQEIEYLTPLDYREAPVRIAVWVSSIGGASFDLSYEVFDSADEGAACYARAIVTMVSFDFDAGAPARLQGARRSALEAVSADPAPMRRR